MDYAGTGRGWFYPGITGALFSLCMVFGSQLDLKGSVPFKEGRPDQHIYFSCPFCLNHTVFVGSDGRKKTKVHFKQWF